mmetsp:Transcript_76583/g.212740  ORF Transcript_76583/g.212740 Transcript_76583/m.212740 type:complete len:248 (-) Transcript_76583:434-1177(-)
MLPSPQALARSTSSPNSTSPGPPQPIPNTPLAVVDALLAVTKGVAVFSAPAGKTIAPYQARAGPFGAKRSACGTARGAAVPPRALRLAATAMPLPRRMSTASGLRRGCTSSPSARSKYKGPVRGMLSLFTKSNSPASERSKPTVAANRRPMSTCKAKVSMAPASAADSTTASSDDAGGLYTWKCSKTSAPSRAEAMLGSSVSTAAMCKDAVRTSNRRWSASSLHAPWQAGAETASRPSRRGPRSPSE